MMFRTQNSRLALVVSVFTLAVLLGIPALCFIGSGDDFLELWLLTVAIELGLIAVVLVVFGLLRLAFNWVERGK